MLATFLFRAAVVTTPWLARLVAAEADQVALQQPLMGTMAFVVGTTMGECAPSITVCGKTDTVLVIHSPKSTSYATVNHTTTTTVELPTQTNVITQVTVETVNPETEGHCRSTTVIYDDVVTTITVDVNVTTTCEFVPIENSTTIVTSRVTGKAIEQCYLKTTDSSTSSSPQSVGENSTQVPPPVSTPAEGNNSPAGTGSATGAGEGYASQSTSTGSSFSASAGSATDAGEGYQFTSTGGSVPASSWELDSSEDENVGADVDVEVDVEVDVDVAVDAGEDSEYQTLPGS
ncbi:hypothetical protein B0T10DRAFT_560107 [Thelonectria olida]|uniref:Uncharacterized protein n=1 Tax=Thelonectria olida TaxID=1576542 RepID=A0A9P9ARA2_9HYPO|nr:hypothetical protein B0T10DRAFT_560107 [Thelonectria olida]